MSISVFTHESKKNKDGEFNVYLRISYKGKRFLVSTGLTCREPLQNGNFAKKERNAAIKRRRLDVVIGIAEDTLLRNKDMSASQAKDAIAEAIDPSRRKTALLTDAFASFSKLKSGRTVGLYEQTEKKVSNFDRKATLDSVDGMWLRNFEKMCAKTMRTNTIAIHMRNIRAVFNWCIDEGMTNNYPFKKFKIKQEKTRKRNLTVEQLRTLRDFPCEDFQKPYRDIFMLMFYLIGINAKDLLYLRKSNLRNGRIEYVRAKTGKRYSIKVEPEAMEIIKRYEGRDYLISPLDRYRNHMDWLHHFNDALKTIGKTYRNGVKKSGNALFPSISSYWSRHTWGTIAAELDTPIDVIAHALGHNIPGLDVTSIYIRFNEKKVDAANRAVIDFVNSE